MGILKGISTFFKLSMESFKFIIRISQFDKEIAEIKETTAKLKDEINATKKKNPLPPLKRGEYFYHGDLLYLKDTEIPHCRWCFENKGKLVCMNEIEMFWWEGIDKKIHQCPECKIQIKT